MNLVVREIVLVLALVCTTLASTRGPSPDLDISPATCTKPSPSSVGKMLFEEQSGGYGITCETGHELLGDNFVACNDGTLKPFMAMCFPLSAGCDSLSRKKCVDFSKLLVEDSEEEGVDEELAATAESIEELNESRGTLRGQPTKLTCKDFPCFRGCKYLNGRKDTKKCWRCLYQKMKRNRCTRAQFWG